MRKNLIPVTSSSAFYQFTDGWTTGKKTTACSTSVFLVRSCGNASVKNSIDSSPGCTASETHAFAAVPV
jgi:hypothetical protein